jgi:hypothetical protein
MIYMCKVLARKPVRKRPLGRPKSRWGDNIIICLKYIGLEGLDWIWVSVGCSEQANEALGLIKRRAFGLEKVLLREVVGFVVALWAACTSEVHIGY